MQRSEETKNHYIQVAFKQDCENLLTEYAKLESLSFTDFAKVWTDMSFSLIYSGKSSYDETRHFTEMCFFEAKKFLIYSKSLYIQTGALYLLYGLYYKQPLKDFVKVRLIQSEFATLKQLIDEMKTRRNLQALYVYLRMKTDDIFEHVYAQTMLAPDLKHFIDNFVMKDDIFQKNDTEKIKDRIKNIIQMNNLSAINIEYETALNEYKASSGQNLQTFNSNVLQEIEKIYNQYEDGSKTKENAEEIKVDDDIGERRRALKQYATASCSKSKK